MTSAELRLFRLERNLSLRQMAHVLRIGVRSLERFEAGEWELSGAQFLLVEIYKSVPGAIEFALSFGGAKKHKPD